MNDKVGKEVGGLDVIHRDLDNFLALGSLWLSLGGDDNSGFLGLGLLEVVLLDSLQEGESGVGVSEVLDSDVDFFLHFSLSDLLLDDDSDASGVHVEDLSGSSVVELVGHSLVDGSVDDNVNVVSLLKLFEVVANSDGSVSSESLLEFVFGV